MPMANNQLNWSHFKPDFFQGKLEEDVEAHFLRTMDRMTTHDFLDDQKVRRFCLTLLGEARLLLCKAIAIFDPFSSFVFHLGFICT